MHIICLTPLVPGIYSNHNADHIAAPPDGWAAILREGDPIPKEWEGNEIDYSLPSTYPCLGSLEAEELTYTREVEVEKPVTKVRDTGEVDEDGNLVMETYTEMETVTETHEYTMMTVTAMTPGIVPEPVPEPPAPPTTEERLSAIEDALCEMDAANAASIAALEDALCEMDMGGAENE